MEQLEDRLVPAHHMFTVNTALDTAFAALNNGVPVDAFNMTSLRAVIEHANANPETGNWNLNCYHVSFTPGVAAQTITLDPNLGTLFLESNFNIIGDGVTIERNVADPAFRLFEVVDEMEVQFIEMTLQGGRAGALDPDGGAIYIHTDVTLKIEGCDFINNEAADRGGAIAAVDDSGSRIFISNSMFGLNTAEVAGGAIFLDGAHTLTVYSSSFVGNEATGVGAGLGFGGGIAVMATLTYIEDTDFIGNVATNDGGGIYVLDCTLTMKYGMLFGNESGGNGGGIYVEADTHTITLDEVSVTDNHASQKGGGAYILKGTLDGQLTALTGNTAGNAIPGIAFKQGQATAPILLPAGPPPGTQTKQAD